MAIRPIVVLGNPVLRQRARKVSRIDQSIATLVGDMIETMRDAPGVGLAAPQIGVPLQVAVIEAEPETVHVIINPEIVKRDGEHVLDEGCLSVPGYWAQVTRAERVVVKARDLKGKEIRISGDGLLGQALQHEIDHLNGTVYVDRLDSLDDLRRASRSRAKGGDGDDASDTAAE